jgi:hypothetical protein
MMAASEQSGDETLMSRGEKADESEQGEAASRIKIH